jgi:formate hydrogenlyase subunit 3/multisubunit Na+/H+ antiporter MnhD subunit
VFASEFLIWQAIFDVLGCVMGSVWHVAAMLTWSSSAWASRPPWFFFFFLGACRDQRRVTLSPPV